MTRRERMLHKTLNDDAIVKETRNRAAIVLQRLFRAHRKGNIVLRCRLSELSITNHFYNCCNVVEKMNHLSPSEKPIITQQDDEEKQKCRRISIGAKGFCPIIHCSKVLQAITDFRKLRIQNLFVEDNMTDIVDIGIAQNQLTMQMDYMGTRIDGIEDKLDKLMDMMMQQKESTSYSRAGEGRDTLYQQPGQGTNSGNFHDNNSVANSRRESRYGHSPHLTQSRLGSRMDLRARRSRYGSNTTIASTLLGQNQNNIIKNPQNADLDQRLGLGRSLDKQQTFDLSGSNFGSNYYLSRDQVHTNPEHGLVTCIATAGKGSNLTHHRSQDVQRSNELDDGSNDHLTVTGSSSSKKRRQEFARANTISQGVAVSSQSQVPLSIRVSAPDMETPIKKTDTVSNHSNKVCGNEHSISTEETPLSNTTSDEINSVNPKKNNSASS